jgi:hypothetical protein
MLFDNLAANLDASATNRPAELAIVAQAGVAETVAAETAAAQNVDGRPTETVVPALTEEPHTKEEAADALLAIKGTLLAVCRLKFDGK